MRTSIYVAGAIVMLSMAQSVSAAEGAISKDYQGMWGAGGCGKAKYYMQIEGNGMRMYAADKRIALGNWDVRDVQKSGDRLIIDTKETNSQKATHMELSKLSNGHLTLMLKIGGNGGVDDLSRC